MKKVQAIVAQGRLRSENAQTTPTSVHFWKLRCWKSAHCCGAKHISHMFGPDVVSRGKSKGLRTWQKWAKREGFVAISKALAGMVWRGCARRMSRGKRSTRDISIRHVRRSERWFLQRGWFCSIRSLDLLILRDSAWFRKTWPHFFAACAAV